MRRLCALALVLWSCAALAAESRIVISIGNDRGDEGETPLDYAESDAARFHEVMLELGGVAPERAYLLTRATAESVRATLNEARGRLKELRAQGPTSVIVYVSSHGDADALHLGGTRLPLAELRAWLESDVADLRVGIVDACRTRIVARAKGGRPAADVAVAAEAPARVGGMVLLTSASDGEPAQEWAELKGSLFTHHLLGGLRGLADADVNGAITINEAYAYAFSRTMARSVQGQAGSQRPTFDLKLAGFGEWALTRTDQAQSTLSFAPGLRGQVWVIDGRGAVVAELEKEKSARVVVALKPGWYRIVVPHGAWADAVEVNLRWGIGRTLDQRDFSRIPLSPIKLRGGARLNVHPWHLGAAYSFGAGPLPGTQDQGELSFSRDLGAWSIRGTASYGSAQAQGDRLYTYESEVGLRAAALWTLPAGFVLLTGGADLRASWIRQQVSLTDAEEIRRIFGIVEHPRDALFVGAGPVAGAWLPLTDRLWLGAEVSAPLTAGPGHSGLELRFRPRGNVGMSWAL